MFQKESEEIGQNNRESNEESRNPDNRQYRL